jgi:hypothetical protein
MQDLYALTLQRAKESVERRKQEEYRKGGKMGMIFPDKIWLGSGRKPSPKTAEYPETQTISTGTTARKEGTLFFINCKQQRSFIVSDGISKKSNNKESTYRDALAEAIQGDVEFSTEFGFIDVISEAKNMIVEVKNGGGWKGAIGQILVYSQSVNLDCRSWAKWICLYGVNPNVRKSIVDVAASLDVGVMFAKFMKSDDAFHLELDGFACPLDVDFN